MTYSEFIKDIICTRGQVGIGTDEYFEKHHIIPKCIGGTDDKTNLIYLYAKEHFIAHKLLAIENPDNYKLVFAWSMMAYPKGDTKRDFYDEITPEEYEQLRLLQSNVSSRLVKGLWKDNTYREQHIWTPERREHLSKVKIGKPGTPHTLAAKIKMSEKKKGKPSNHKGKTMSEESKKKISIAVSGEHNPMYGKTHSEEAREKMSLAAKREHAVHRKWWNNGIIQVFQPECPDGFTQGRLPFKEGNMVGKYIRNKNKK